MKQLLNIIIFMMIGGFIGAYVQMAIQTKEQPQAPFQSITDKQVELNAMGCNIVVDGRLGPETQRAWDDAWMATVYKGE